VSKEEYILINRLLRKCNTDTLFNRLEQYISPVNSEWSNKLKPASQEKIEKVLRISRVKEAKYHLPKKYLEYLKYMGEGDGDLLSYALHANTDLDTIYSVYEGKKEDPFDIIEPNRYIFAFNTDVGVEYYITTKENGEQIIVSGNDKRYGMEYFSENFEKLMFQTAYDVYERKYNKYQYYLGTNRITLDNTLERLGIGIDNIFQMVDGVVQKYGFRKIWFSDAYHYYAFKENLSFGLRRDMALSGYVFGNDEKEVEKYGNILNKLLGTKKQ